MSESHDELLVQRGREIVSSLGSGTSQLDRWMAHYVAELLDRYEREGSDPSSEVAQRCSDVIARLWQIRIRRQVARVQYDLAQWGKRVERDLERWEQLGQAIRDEGPTDSEVLTESDAVRLWDLAEMEMLIAEAWQLAHSLQKADPEARSEVETLLGDPKWRVDGVKKALSAAFPSFEKVDFSNVEAVNAAAVAALNAIQAYRCRRWFRGDENPS